VDIYYLRDLFTAARATGPHLPVKWSGSGEVFTRDEIVMGYHNALGHNMAVDANATHSIYSIRQKCIMLAIWHNMKLTTDTIRTVAS
jgi:hypothetical protein